MSTFIDSIYRLNNNSFIFTPLIVSFYEKLPQTPKNILLAYLVLPLVLNDISRKNIKNSKKSSTIYTFANTRDKDKRKNLFGLTIRVKRYKDLTNSCIQYAIDNGMLLIESDLSVKFIKPSKSIHNNLKDAHNACCKLHNIFKDLDIVTIYKMLGVNEL
ncbi:three component ABC system middle component [Campylobacter mucosalis]|uniref:three component ABC system middle component n=1 Tax=Campylobacter mucosalis TaxID=202 RepID=UPI000689586B|nr:three component ABC system middle component [Campylobacter mucosalis]QKF62443.1 hypothetical protein CMCT_0276 [Campylobacter mucosalis]